MARFGKAPISESQLIRRVRANQKTSRYTRAIHAKTVTLVSLYRLYLLSLLSPRPGNRDNRGKTYKTGDGTSDRHRFQPSTTHSRSPGARSGDRLVRLDAKGRFRLNRLQCARVEVMCPLTSVNAAGGFVRRVFYFRPSRRVRLSPFRFSTSSFVMQPFAARAPLRALAERGGVRPSCR